MSPQNNNADRDEDLTPEEAGTTPEDQQDPAPETDAAVDEDTPVEELDAADSETEALKAEIADLKDRLLRTLAESDNIRKRAEKERADTAKFAVSNFARQLLTVADNLRRALDAIPEEERKESDALNTIFVGVEATERELLRAFESSGIKMIDATDQIFDPNYHEVMFEADMPDKTPGTVIQVLEPGYMIHDRLLRPARVGVAKGGKKNNAAAQVDENV